MRGARWTWAIACALGGMGALGAAACAGTHVGGRVVSCADQKPIEGADLAYVDTSTMKTSAGATQAKTDKDGRFSGDFLGSGSTYSVKVQKDGYQAAEQTLQSGGDTQICLNPKAAGQ